VISSGVDWALERSPRHLPQAKGFQRPHVGFGVMAKDIEVPIVRANFEVRVLGSIPLIQKFLDNIIVIIKLKADRTLVSFIPE
jgi:hypothetical protein